MDADIVLINGKVITVDSNFSIAEAVAISGDTVLAVGSDREIRKLTGKSTRTIDLNGKTVIPGLNDAHLHPDAAALSELDEEIPDVHNIEELLAWIKDQTLRKEKGSWIVFRKFFSTRLEEMRQPSIAELDNAAPEHPVFLNGSFGGMINSCAMKLSGINKWSKDPGIMKDEHTGLPTGFIRASAFPILKIPASREISQEEWIKAFTQMMMKYNQYGITSICAGTGDFKTVKMYREMADSNILTVRILQNILLQADELITRESIKKILNGYPEVTGSGDKWVRTGPLKVFLDGGILTGTAYMEEPWGEKAYQ
ncbi:MAG: amidohydrolase family protein, partial [Bacteroidia bacterium]|nr:amidohydrolase family protein [Bacteroidia bacterium]